MKLLKIYDETNDLLLSTEHITSIDNIIRSNNYVIYSIYEESDAICFNIKSIVCEKCKKPLPPICSKCIRKGRVK